MGALENGQFGGEMEDSVKKLLIIDRPQPESGSRSKSGSGSGSSDSDIEEAVTVLLQGLGEDHQREGIKKTPVRVAKAFRDGTKGYKQRVKDIVEGALFPEAGLENEAGFAGGVGGLVVVRDINLFSYCESCLLPFSIECHIGYVPSGHRVVGLSKLSRVADVFAKRFQDPQRLANEICSALHNSIKPAGVVVALQCWHIQFPEAFSRSPNPKHPSRSAKHGWVEVSVFSSSGVFKDGNSTFLDDFSAILKFRGINMESGSQIQPWCPLMSLETPQGNGHGICITSNGRTFSKQGATQSAMVSAVASILKSLGEDPMRKELVGTPHRYVQWLLNFKRSSLEPKHLLSLHNSGGGNEIFSELNLPFCAQCEHHLLPFHGVVHVGYFGEEEGVAVQRSFLQSVVNYYGCKLQVQERVTRQIAEAIYSVLSRGVMVVVEANHICMISRGIEKVGSNTATIAVMGQFATDPGAKALFLQAISNGTAKGG